MHAPLFGSPEYWGKDLFFAVFHQSTMADAIKIIRK